MFNDAAATTLDHLTAVGNAAEHYGGVLYTILEVPTVRNSILWGNTAEKGELLIGTALFVESIVEGGCPVGVSCMHVHDEDPLLGAPGNYGGAVDTIPVLTGSPAIDLGRRISVSLAMRVALPARKSPPAILVIRQTCGPGAAAGQRRQPDNRGLSALPGAACCGQRHQYRGACRRWRPSNLCFARQRSRDYANYADSNF